MGTAGTVTGRAPDRQQSKERFSTLVLGPRFAEIARTWVRDFADPELLGDLPGNVTSGVVNDAPRRTTHEVDVVALGSNDHRRKAVLGIGEVKWGRQLGSNDLARLRRIRSLLEPRTDVDVERARLLCFGANGFTDELQRDADIAGSEVVLVDLNRLYTGS